METAPEGSFSSPFLFRKFVGWAWLGLVDLSLLLDVRQNRLSCQVADPDRLCQREAAVRAHCGEGRERALCGPSTCRHKDGAKLERCAMKYRISLLVMAVVCGGSESSATEMAWLEVDTL
ncbi:hypothetical protein, partial [Rhodovulum sulfidophilum]|uniref:hypothetical protein n=1 Tax=Rhodovulum sulfidophilum TaxID=35806 RepID=UPI001F3A8126